MAMHSQADGKSLDMYSDAFLKTDVLKTCWADASITASIVDSTIYFNKF
jgi:hypothetical protein